MLTNYRSHLSDLRAPETRAILNHLRLPYSRRIWPALQKGRVMSDAFVLALLRVNTGQTLKIAEAVVGRPIQRCAPRLAAMRKLIVETKPKGKDDIRILKVRPFKLKGHVTLNCTPLYSRLGRIKVGMSIAQILMRGVSRKDIRIAKKRKWIVVEKIKVEKRRAA